MRDIPDDPIITYMEQTGFPPWYRAETPICPVCGSECDLIFKDRFSDIIGCNECIKICDAVEVEECFKEG